MKEIGSIEGLEGLSGSEEEIGDRTEIKKGAESRIGADKLIGHLDGFFLRSSLKLDGETIHRFLTFGKSRHRR
jgi:hypothetical protein